MTNTIDIVRIVASEGEEVFRIDKDGKVHIGSKYTVEEAAKRFWVAVEQYCPKYLKQSTLKWTDKKPKTPGYYWYRRKKSSHCEIVEIKLSVLDKKLQTWSRSFKKWLEVKYICGQWSDKPVTKPEE